MKKITVAFLSILLLVACCAFVASATEAVNVERGSNVEVLIPIDEHTGIKSGSIAFTYDTDVFEIVSGEWLVDGAFIEDFDTDTSRGVFAFSSSKTVGGVIFRLVLNVKETAPYGDTELSAAIKLKNNSTGEEFISNVEFDYTVYCYHTYSGMVWDENEHWYECSKCHGEAEGGRGGVEAHSFIAGCDTFCGGCLYERAPVPGHLYNDEVTAPTCISDGYTTHTCVCCGDSYVDSYVEGGGHSYSSVVIAPTCERGGFTVFVCVNCGDSYTGDETEQVEHDFVEIAIVAPADGSTFAVQVCRSCGAFGEAAHRHEYAAVVTPASCTEGGYTTYTCECGDTYVGDETDVLGHSYEVIVIDPTCIENGYSIYTCERCGDSYIDDEILATGHLYQAIIVPPTCVSSGETKYYCVVCEDCYIDPIPPIEHAYEVSEKVEPTCTESGYTTYMCPVCGESYTGDYTAPLGHNLVEGEKVASTCIAEGHTIYNCTLCDYVYKEIVAKLPHTNVDKVVEPNCKYKGYTLHTCIVCGATSKDNYVPTNGVHVYDNIVDPECNLCDYIREDLVAYGSCGLTTYWKLNRSGVFTLCGNGSTNYYTGKGMPWYKYRSQITKVVVENGIQSIGASSFYDFTAIKTVVLPDTLIAIGQYAFYGCSGIEKLEIPASVHFIGNYAFRRTSTNKSGIIFKSKQGWSVGGTAVTYNEMADAKGIADRLRRTDFDKNWLKSNSSPEIIAEGTCGKNLTWRFDSAGTLTIRGTGKMTDFLTKGAPWYSFNAAILKISVEEGVTSIGKCAFYGADNVQTVKLPTSLETIGSYAFYYCRNLSTISIPKNVVSIKSYAFRQCRSLTSIKFGIKYGWSAGTVTFTSTELSGEGSVQYFTKLYYSKDWTRDVNAPDDSDPNRVAAGTCGTDLRWVLDKDGILTISGTGKMTNYNSSGSTLPWLKYADRITKVVVEEGVTSIGDYAFYNVFTSLRSIKLPSSLTSIGKYAFYNCSSMQELSIPRNVTSIGAYAFRKMGTVGVTTVTFKETAGWTCGGTAIDASFFADAKAVATAVRGADYTGAWTR